MLVLFLGLEGKAQGCLGKHTGHDCGYLVDYVGSVAHVGHRALLSSPRDALTVGLCPYTSGREEAKSFSVMSKLGK